jgi:hypothetical protein
MELVLYRKPKSHKVVANTFDDGIDTHNVVYGLECPLKFVDIKSSRTLVGVIELSREKTLLVAHDLCDSLGIDNVT